MAIFTSIIYHLNKNKEILTLLLLADLIFLILHICHLHSPVFSSYLFSIEQDGSYAEVYQYLKEFWIIICLAIIGNRKNYWGYLAWAAFFVFILLDDSLTLHETIGSKISLTITDEKYFYGIRSQDIGELLVFGAAFIMFAPFIGIAYLSSNKDFKVLTHEIILLVGVLAFAAIAIDFVHEFFWLINSTIFDTIGAFEDSVEMISMSLLYCFAYSRATSPT